MANQSIYGSPAELRDCKKLMSLVDAELIPKKETQAGKIKKGLELYLENIKENGSE